MGGGGPAHHAGRDDVGHGTIETAVEATKIGAFDFLEKPVGLQKLLGTVSRALKAEATREPRRISLAPLGGSNAVRDVERQLEALVAVRKPVLILGEAGVGHEIAAAAPSGGLRLLLTRTTAVLAFSTPCLTVAGLLLPSSGARLPAGPATAACPPASTSAPRARRPPAAPSSSRCPPSPTASGSTGR